jgi:hypothetical protein
MTKAFRNTGLEGGYGDLATQNWLHGLHKSGNRYAKKTGEKPVRWNSISAAKDPPAKKASWQFQPSKEEIAILLSFAEDATPEFHGTWRHCINLCGKGLATLVEPPTRWHRHDGACHGIGAKFQITLKGLEYVKWLKAASDKA